MTNERPSDVHIYHNTNMSTSGQETGNGKRDLRVMVLGKDGVGKSALIVRYLTKRFIHDYDARSESFYTFNLNLDNQRINIQLLDTAGINELSSLLDVYRVTQMEWADAFLVVFSFTDRDSFEMVQPIIEQLRCYHANVPITVIGNKSDLVHMRQVTIKEGATVADILCCLFFELSASEDIDPVSTAFVELFRAASQEKYRLMTSQPALVATSSSRPKSMLKLGLNLLSRKTKTTAGAAGETRNTAKAETSENAQNKDELPMERLRTYTM